MNTAPWLTVIILPLVAGAITFLLVFSVLTLTSENTAEPPWVWVDPNYCVEHGEGLLCYVDPNADPKG